MGSSELAMGPFKAHERRLELVHQKSLTDLKGGDLATKTDSQNCLKIRSLPNDYISLSMIIDYYMIYQISK